MSSSRAYGHPVIITPRDRLWRLHGRFQHRLPMWVIYRPVTREYPGFWVSRMHFTLPQPLPTRVVITDVTLAGLRSNLPPGLTRLARDPDDVPEIEEVWL